MNQNENAIEVRGVSKFYNLYERPQDRVKELFSLTKKKYHTLYKALDQVSFTVKKGETLGIIGRNGAGKSTLLKLITGVITPSEGTIETHGEISALLELGTGFNPEYTGYENIFLNGSMRGFSDEEMQEKVKEIVDFADIGEYMGQPVKTYSSGMFARLAFAVMISFKPEILLSAEVHYLHEGGDERRHQASRDPRHEQHREYGGPRDFNRPRKNNPRGQAARSH